MDKAILTVLIIVCGVIFIAILLLTYYKSEKNKSRTVIQRKMYTLGSNLAKIGWAKTAPDPTKKDILFSTMSLLKELNFSQELERELEGFAEKKEGVKELQESLPRIKGLIGRQVAAHYGRNNVGYYNIGFNMINVSPVLEQATMNIEEAGKAASQSIHGIEGDASTLGLPTSHLKTIRKMVDEGLYLHNSEVFGQARSGLIKVSQNYVDILEQK